MLGYLTDSDRMPTDRTLRLFAVACCRRSWHRLTDERYRTAVAVAERFADGRADAAELNAAQDVVTFDPPGSGWDTAWYVADVNPLDAGWECCGRAARSDETRKQCEEAALLRDIVGDPFRPAPALDPAWLTWQGGAVRKLAQATYEERRLPEGKLDPARLAVLADALEDAGCTDANLLAHLRGPGPHVRG
jgi:hypothetical protein